MASAAAWSPEDGGGLLPMVRQVEALDLRNEAVWASFTLRGGC